MILSRLARAVSRAASLTTQAASLIGRPARDRLVSDRSSGSCGRSLSMDAGANGSEAQLKAIEHRLDRLSIRADGVEGLLFTIAEAPLASLGEAEARAVVSHLRENIRAGEAKLSGDWDPCEDGEFAALETEVYATGLLDLVELSASQIRDQSVVRSG